MKTRQELLEITFTNLKKVVDELPELAEQLPEIRENFSMDQYGVYDDLTRYSIVNQPHVCNTVGCGLGNIARLFNLNNSAFYNREINDEYFDYHLFSNAIFPAFHSFKSLNVNSCGEFNWGRPTWDYLFNEDWIDYYPTFDNFIQRCKNVLNHGELIKRFDYDTMEILE